AAGERRGEVARRLARAPLGAAARAVAGDARGHLVVAGFGGGDVAPRAARRQFAQARLGEAALARARAAGDEDEARAAAASSALAHGRAAQIAAATYVASPARLTTAPSPSPVTPPRAPAHRRPAHRPPTPAPP